ncbi:MAG: hypothetical protein P1U57_09945 [Oleibacter sp.]|nr:hypothetical protein [Thalassolituus sp.]
MMMPSCDKFSKRLVVSVLLFSLLVSSEILALPECPDFKAKEASDALALAFFKSQGEVFHPTHVLKKHHPSRDKEVVSYIKNKERYYSIFSLVNADCDARFIKRTRQND